MPLLPRANVCWVMGRTEGFDRIRKTLDGEVERAIDPSQRLAGGDEGFQFRRGDRFRRFGSSPGQLREDDLRLRAGFPEAGEVAAFPLARPVIGDLVNRPAAHLGGVDFDRVGSVGEFDGGAHGWT